MLLSMFFVAVIFFFIGSVSSYFYMKRKLGIMFKRIAICNDNERHMIARLTELEERFQEDE